MPKAYWISTYRSVNDAEKLAAYAKLAGPSIAAGGGRFLARGEPAKVYELGLMQRTVVIEFDSVAQAIAAPGERWVDDADNEPATKPMKFDLRAYTYDGAVQWMAARLYQGQTTNFRTPGGGFAPVFSAVDALGGSAQACVCGDESAAVENADWSSAAERD